MRAWVIQFCEQLMLYVIGTSTSALTPLVVWVNPVFAVPPSPTAFVKCAFFILAILPFPFVCIQCDGEHYVCVLCESNGVLWSAGGEARTAGGDPEEMLEISAFRDENGEVVRINPPLRIPISQVTDEQPVDAHLEAYLRAHGM